MCVCVIALSSSFCLVFSFSFRFVSFFFFSCACARLNVHIRICITSHQMVEWQRIGTEKKDERKKNEKRRRQGRTYVKQKKRRLCAIERQWEWCVVDIRTYVCITKKEAFTSLLNSLRFFSLLSLFFSLAFLFFSCLLLFLFGTRFSVVLFFFSSSSLSSNDDIRTAMLLVYSIASLSPSVFPMCVMKIGREGGRSRANG